MISIKEIAMILETGATWSTYQDEKRDGRVKKMRIHERFISSLNSIVIQVLDDGKSFLRSQERRRMLSGICKNERHSAIRGGVERRATALILGQGIEDRNSIDGKSILSTSLPIQDRFSAAPSLSRSGRSEASKNICWFSFGEGQRYRWRLG